MNSQRRRDLRHLGAVAAAAVTAALAGAPTPNAARAQDGAAPPPAAAPAPGAVPVPVGPPPLSPQAAAALSAPLRPDQAELLLAMLADAPLHGFHPGEFGEEGLAEAVRAGDPSADAWLKSAALAYARAQHGGRIPEDAFLKDWAIRPAAYDARRAFANALAQDRLDVWIVDQPPPFERYRVMQRGLAAYKRIAAGKGWGRVAEGPPLKPGVVDSRVLELRERIAFEDVHTLKAPRTKTYDKPLVEAVQRFQFRHGIPFDGIVGGPTLRALNASPADRVKLIEANLERWRWLPRTTPADRIEVNIAAASLDLYTGDQVEDTMRAVAGKPTSKTPMLMSEISSVVLNPPWNVPTSIATKELLPKGRGYLERNGYRVISLENGGVRLQQKPGEGNALGRVKFDFPNPYAIYLHDTSTPGAFDRNNRALSHGCIRVQRPVELAKRLLRDQANWQPEAVDAALETTTTQRAVMDRGVAVMLLYFTAVPGKGQLEFRDDIYGWDQALLDLLEEGRAPQLSRQAQLAAELRGRS